MAQWKYTITSGTALREAIYDGDTERTVECLLKCCSELHNKLSEEDLEDCSYELEDIIESLKVYTPSDDEDDTENIDAYLGDFYDICDSVRAFVAL